MLRNKAGQVVTANLTNRSTGLPVDSGVVTVQVLGDGGTKVAGVGDIENAVPRRPIGRRMIRIREQLKPNRYCPINDKRQDSGFRSANSSRNPDCQACSLQPNSSKFATS